MDGQVALEVVFEARMKLLYILLEEGVEPAVVRPLFELLATELVPALGTGHSLTLEAELGAEMCAARSTDDLTDAELLSHALVLTRLDEQLARRRADDPLRAEIASLRADVDRAAQSQAPATASR
jgi:hypothetical protein